MMMLMLMLLYDDVDVNYDAVNDADAVNDDAEDDLNSVGQNDLKTSYNGHSCLRCSA